MLEKEFDIISQIKNKIKIDEIYPFTGLDKHKVCGDYIINPCPLCGHNDHFCVKQDYTKFNSFGCGHKGDVINFYAALNAVDIKTAIKDLKEKLDIKEYKKPTKEEIQEIKYHIELFKSELKRLKLKFISLGTFIKLLDDDPDIKSLYSEIYPNLVAIYDKFVYCKVVTSAEEEVVFLSNLLHELRGLFQPLNSRL